MYNITKKEYSAGAVSKSFWFSEFRKYNELIHEDFTDKEIKELQKDRNIFLASSYSIGTSTVNEVSRRWKILPDDFNVSFQKLSIDSQRYINLLGIIMTDRLFFEFMYEVFREKLLIKSLTLEEKDFRLFFSNKSIQSDKVNSLTEQTKKRLIGTYKNYLRESNLIYDENKEIRINPPILDFDLEELFNNNKDIYTFIRIFLGE